MEGHHEVVPARHYVYNFLALMVLMFLTVYIASFDFGALNLAVALAIAITKATLIVLIFMDVRNGTKLVRLFAVGGFVWFLIMISLTLSDFWGVQFASAYTNPLPGAQH